MACAHPILTNIALSALLSVGGSCYTRMRKQQNTSAPVSAEAAGTEAKLDEDEEQSQVATNNEEELSEVEDSDVFTRAADERRRWAGEWEAKASTHSTKGAAKAHGIDPYSSMRHFKSLADVEIAMKRNTCLAHSAGSGTGSLGLQDAILSDFHTEMPTLVQCTESCVEMETTRDPHDRHDPILKAVRDALAQSAMRVRGLASLIGSERETVVSRLKTLGHWREEYDAPLKVAYRQGSEFAYEMAYQWPKTGMKKIDSSFADELSARNGTELDA